MRQRLLENKTLDLAMMFDQARVLESAQKSCGSYGFPAPPVGAAIPLCAPPDSENLLDVGSLAATSQSHSQGIKCYFCGFPKHPQIKCPPRDASCNKCQCRGHFAKVCESSPPPSHQLHTYSQWDISSHGGICCSFTNSSHECPVLE